MSELTLCNHCRLQDIKRRAKQEGKGVTVLYNSKWHGGKGCNVYVHPKHVKVRDIEEDSELHVKYSVSWFMELSDECCC